MEREIDLAPRHLIGWLKADLARGGNRKLTVRATREFLAEDGPAAADDLDPEDEMLVLTTVGLLEIAPPPGGPHWVLRMRVEDPFGSHLPDDGSVPDGPEDMGLEDFETCFLADGALDATITLETESAADDRGFEPVLAR